jgi:macrolide transport system ATP-binding/permease protein
MGMRLREGRDFRWEDVPEQTDKKTHVTTGGPNVVIVNQAAARLLWPNENALGKRAVLDGGDMPDATVIGVVDDVRQTSLETKAGPEFYVPVKQHQGEGAQLVVRSKLPVGTLGPSVLAAVRAVNAGQPAYELRPLGSIVDHAVSPRRFFLVLVVSFAGLGLVLASLGIYGVIAYSVTQRTQEIGIRMALGSSAEAVQRGVMAKTLRLAGLGVALGTVASLVLARGMAALLYGTAATDPVTYVGMVGLLLGVAVLAGYLPARRAARINPAVALRN